MKGFYTFNFRLFTHFYPQLLQLNHLKKHKIILNIEVGFSENKPCNLPG